MKKFWQTTPGGQRPDSDSRPLVVPATIWVDSAVGFLIAKSKVAGA